MASEVRDVAHPVRRVLGFRRDGPQSGRPCVMMKSVEEVPLWTNAAAHTHGRL